MTPEHPLSSALPPKATADSLAAVRRSRPEDYDGHTEFAQMSPDARLRWLEAAVRFVQASKGVHPPPVQSG